MNLSLSPQLRVIALAGLAALVGLLAVVMTVGRHQGSAQSSSATPAPAVVHHKTAPAAVAPKTAKPAVRPAKPRTPAVVTVALAHGWPVPVARAFAKSRVVVAVVYSSEAALDRDALAEATAGAAQSRAVVVPLDVSSEAEAATRKMLAKFGTMDSPVTLVLRRPGELFVRLDGYADQQSVAQAVANAALPS